MKNKTFAWRVYDIYCIIWIMTLDSEVFLSIIYKLTLDRDSKFNKQLNDIYVWAWKGRNWRTFKGGGSLGLIDRHACF